MRHKLTLAIVLALGVLLGLALVSWRALPTDDMIARASCAECHDVHGAVEWADAPSQSQVWVLGDVVTSTYFVVNDLFPYANDTPGTQITLVDLLARYGAGDFRRVALESLDGGVVTLEREFVTEESVLVPQLEGIRFKDENQHKSVWLSGVRWITVEGSAAPLTIAGQPTSLGRLLMADRTMVVTEGGEASYISPVDGQTYRGNYAHSYVGASLEPLLRSAQPYSKISARDAKGRAKEITLEQAEGAIVGAVSGRPSLILPRASRARWVVDVTEITPLP